MRSQLGSRYRAPGLLKTPSYARISLKTKVKIAQNFESTGAKTIGPRIYPIIYIETTRIETSWLAPSVCSILRKAPEGAEEANVEFNTELSPYIRAVPPTVVASDIYHLFHSVQVLGFNGSFWSKAIGPAPLSADTISSDLVHRETH